MFEFEQKRGLGRYSFHECDHCFFGGSSAPAAPAPAATIAQTTASNKETAVANAGLAMVDQFGPNGSVTHGQAGTWPDGTPRFQQFTNLTETAAQTNNNNQLAQRNLSGLAQDQSSRLRDHLNSSPDYSNGAIANNQIGYEKQKATFNATPQNVQSTFQRNTSASPTGTNIARQNISADPALASRLNSLAGQNAVQGTNIARQDIDSNEQLEGRLVDLGRRRLDPQLADRRKALEQDLANKGIGQGSDAYEKAMSRNEESENDAYNQLALNGQNQAFGQAATRSSQAFGQDAQAASQNYQQASSAQNSDRSFATTLQNQNYQQAANTANQEFGQDAQAASQNFQLANSRFNQDRAYDAAASGQEFSEKMAASGQNFSQNAQAQQIRQGQETAASQSNFANDMAARQQSLQEISARRNAPINEIGALMSGSQVTQPTFSAAPRSQMANTDVAGITQGAYNSQLQAYNAQNQSNGSIWGTLGGIAGMGMRGIMGSDKKLKKDIKLVGKTKSGLAVSDFKYKDDPKGQTYRGVMAQDVKKKHPDAVKKVNGILAVDWSKLSKKKA
jgi:hypothetical protein